MTDANPKATHIVTQWKAESPLVSCRFDPAADYVYAGGQDSSIYRWSMDKGEMAKLTGHESWVRDFAFINQGKTMIACDYAGRLLWWSVGEAEPKVTKTVEAHHGWARCMALGIDGQTIATGGNDNLVKLWHSGTGELLQTLPGHERHVYSVLMHPDGKTLLSGDLMGQVRQWDLASGKTIQTFDAKDLTKFDPTFRAQYGGVRSMALSPDGKYLACAGMYECTNAFAGINKPAVVRFDWASQEKLKLHVSTLRSLVWRVRFHESGFLIAAAGGGGGGHLVFWGDDEKPTHQFKLPSVARDMDTHPDGVRVATIHSDSQLRISRMAPKAS